MDEWIRWAVTTIVGILGILVGRTWEKYDRNVQKDRDLLKKLLESLPIESDTIRFLREQDFGGEFEREFIRNISHSWKNAGVQPDFFFLNRKLENLRSQLFDAIDQFLSESGQKTFTLHDDTNYLRVPKPHEAVERYFSYLLGDRSWAELSQNEQIEIDSQLETIRAKAESDYHETVRNLNIKASKIVKIYDELIRESRKIL